MGEPDTGPDSRSIALTFRAGGRAAHVLCNAWWEPLDFDLPDPGAAGPWRLIVDTNLASPDDLVTDAAAAPTIDRSYRVEGRSVVVLVGSTHDA